MTHLVSKTLLSTAASALILSGCVASNGGGNVGGITNDQARIIAGSVLGGVVGHQMGKGDGKKAMTIIGAVVGGYIGGMMSNQSRQRTNYALEKTPTNQPTTWTEPQTNNRYTVTPTRTYSGNVNGTQSVCRDYKMDAYIDGRLQQVTGRACRNANGQWVATR